MNIKDSMKIRTHVRGEIELFSVRNGQFEELLQKSNVILNGGADLLAYALANQKWVNGMYFAYDNNNPPYEDTTPPADRTAAFYQDPGDTETRGVIRVPTISIPEFSSTDDIYNSNKVSFTAITSGGPAVETDFNGLMDNVSQFYGAGMGWLDPDDDITNDLLFSAVTFSDLGGQDYYTKLAGAEIGLRWSIIFEAP